ncbi:MAG: InlB B-repeat-containing protein, partial [Limisphaerales bacterium]
TFEPRTINFYGGSITTNIPPFSQVTYRIDVPAEATRWKHTSTHTTNLQLSIEQGTVPYKSSSDDFRSSGINSSLNQYLLTAWPWVPNQSYFLTVTNIGTNTEPFTFTMDGRNAVTDDNDNDLLADAWEFLYFGNLNQTATGDYDLDGISNLDEYLEGTNPADNTSFRPRLTTSAANGSILRDVTLPSYTMGSTVMLTPVANTGFAFVNWTGNASGTAVPYPLLMNGHKTVSALFKVVGDDFSIRVPLYGRNITANSSNIGATKEPGEPNHAGNPGGKSVWWTWNPVSAGPVTISTAGSTFNTVLGVYTGSTVSNLTLVASDYNSLGGTNRSRVTFTPNPCATYQIAVDGLWAASGYITLSINQAPTSLLITGPTKGPGGFQFTVQGDPNQIYAIDASTDLTNWVQIGFVTNACSSAIPVTDISATNAPARFYRFRSP